MADDEPKLGSKLQGRNLKSIARYMGSDKCKRVVVMAGAGISTSAGIPDFRSPETGLYANLESFDLPYPEAVFDINFFKEKPEPFYALAKELEPGKFRPTLAHSFIRLLADKTMLSMCFTQNIDTLERRAGVPAEQIVEAHGSFATHACIRCKKTFPDEDMKEAVQSQKVPRCVSCKGLVKPNIVFFGEGLPPQFFASMSLVPKADLVIVMGTSLTVQPFASLPSMADRDTPRLLINLEEVGDMGTRVYDVLALGDCDNTVKKLCELLGWGDELEALWAATAPVDPEDGFAKDTVVEKASGQSKKDELEKQIDDISKAIEESLSTSDRHAQRVAKELGLPSEAVEQSVKAASKTDASISPDKAGSPVGEPTKTDSKAADEETEPQSDQAKPLSKS